MLTLIIILVACSAEDNVQTVAESAVAQTVETPVSAETETEAALQTDAARPDGWSTETHSKDVDPNYDVVFPQDAVNTLTITIDPENWQAMLDNMTELYGEPGARNSGIPGGGAPAAGAPPTGGRAAGGPPAGEPDFSNTPPRPGGEPGAIPGAGGQPADFGVSENPDFVPATIAFDGDTWTNVGIRFKGNSTLMNSWASGSVELPFKLDFDEFEDDYPEIDNQRFYGFKQLSLSNNVMDASYMRTAAAYDIFEDAGLAAPETAWYEIFVDYGEGPVSFGVYTVVEVVDDTVIDAYFGSDDGNIYEGDGTGASLAAGTFDLISASFQKENNTGEADYSDIEALYTVLNADTRLTDNEAWQAELEAIFDVDTFLEWLAINTAIVNWDTYGQMTHNFYLYNNPETGLLTWIPWDYNESMNTGGRGGVKSLGLTEVTDAWPLIRYLLDVPAYNARYVDYVAEVADGAYNANSLIEQLTAWENLLAPYAEADGNAESFATAVDELISFSAERAAAIDEFLAQQ
jgi:hypothetical protein